MRSYDKSSLKEEIINELIKWG